MAGQGTIYTTSDTTTTKLTIADYISIIDPRDAPLVTRWGLANQGKFSFENFPNHKYIWQEDTYNPLSATLGEAMDTTETAMDVATGHGVRFHVGDVWRSDETGELILVTAHDGTDTVTTVIRNWNAAQGGSQATAQSAITTATGLTFLYNARREGAESTATQWTVPTQPYNYSQILHAEIKVTRSEAKATTRYGIPDQEQRQIQRNLGGVGGGKGKKGRSGELINQIEKTFFYGQRVQRSSSSVEGAMGGFTTFVTTNVTNASGVRLREEMINDTIQTSWAAGGMPNLIICNAFNKRLISSWYQGSIQTDRTEGTGGSVINSIETEFGTMGVMLNRWCPSDKVYIVQEDLLGWVELDGFFVEELAKTGDYTRKQIVGEYGFVLQNEKAHGYIYGLATS